MKTDDRFREAERKEDDISLENIMGREEERKTLHRPVHNLRTRLPADFFCNFQYDCLVRGVIFHIPLSLLGKARLSLLISVSRAKTLSSWSSFEDPIYCVPVTPCRELRQHTVR